MRREEERRAREEQEAADAEQAALRAEARRKDRERECVHASVQCDDCGGPLTSVDLRAERRCVVGCRTPRPSVF